MANEIVWYDDTETGAPVLNNAAGALIALLDALLVTGFNSQTLTSVSVTGGVATVTKAGHGYTTARMLDIAGAGTALVNGRKLVTVTSSSTFTFPAAGVADGTISGTITAKRSPLGWARTHSGGATVGMYSRTDSAATAMSLRVDDSSGVQSYPCARVVMVESFSDVNTYSNPTPTAAQISGGQYWMKGANSSAAKPWLLVGDGRTFWLFLDSQNYPASNYSGVPVGPYSFGDLKSYKAADAYACMLVGNLSSSGESMVFGQSAASPGSAPTALASMVARSANAIGAGIPALNIATHRFGGSSSGAYPSPVDNGLVVSMPVLVYDATASIGAIRGEARGIADPLANIPMGLLHKQVLSNLTGSSRDFLAVSFQMTGSQGHMLFDITGPWA